MNPLDRFSAYRGKRFTPEEAALFHERFAGADADVLNRSIDAAADAGFGVTLENIAAKFVVIQENVLRAAIAAHQAAKRLYDDRTSPEDAGWPTKPHSPTTTYLAAITWAAIYGHVAAECMATRYVRGGLVLREHADEIIAVIPTPDATISGPERACRLKHALLSLERRIGLGATIKAETWVANQRAIFAPPTDRRTGREPGEDES